MATRVESNRPIDVEMYDSASNLGSEASYQSNVNPRANLNFNLKSTQMFPSQQPPLDASQFRPLGGTLESDDLGDDNRARPGRPPARPDTELTSEELRRRNRRRQRNREAAQRCRQRRLDQIDVLKDEVRMLKEDSEDQRQENNQLKNELRKIRFQLDLYERTVGPLNQLTAQSYRQPMLVQPAIKMESTSQVQNLHLDPQQIQNQLQPQIQPIMVPMTSATQTAVAAATQPPQTASSHPESSTPASVSTTSPPIPSNFPKGLISPFSAGLVPLISPQTGVVFAYTPTPTQPGLTLHTPFTPTLNSVEPGFFTFPPITKQAYDKARKDSTTQFDRVASEVTTAGASSTAQPVSGSGGAVEDVSDGNNSVNGSVKSTHDDKSSETTENK